MGRFKGFALLVIAILLACSLAPVIAVHDEGFGEIETSWEPVNKKYENFTDLGHHIVKIDTYTETNFDRAVEVLTEKGYIPSDGGCSAVATTNEYGNVIIGRNLDETITENPIYLTTSCAGKYKTFGMIFNPIEGGISYEQLLKNGRISDDAYCALPYIASDMFNEKGLYIEVNMRFPNQHFDNHGTNPDASQKLPLVAINYLVAMNCATVDEAVDYIMDSYSYVSLFSDLNPKKSGTNQSFMIGDAEGNYGVIEIAHDQVVYLPFCKCQTNHYRNPAWGAMEKDGSGYSRRNVLMNSVGGIHDVDSAISVMKAVRWTNITMSVESSYRGADGKIVFCDTYGNRTFDWRDDFARDFIVGDDGIAIVLQSRFADLKDPELKKTLLELASKGKLLIAGENNPIGMSIMHANVYLNACMWIDTEGKLIDEETRKQILTEYQKDWDTCFRYYLNCDREWLTDDSNFEVLQALRMMDISDFGVTDMIEKFHAGDEAPLREYATEWFTEYSLGVDCHKKEMKMLMFENDSLTISYKWKRSA